MEGHFDADHQDQQTEERSNQEENNLMITGPPASRTVIDNLKKLLVQRQHSRESDTENKNAARSNSGSNSDAAFYSQFSTSTSDSDDSSDDYMIFQEISNQADNNNGSSTNHSNRRRHRRRRSYSSSSSSSPSPVARSRRKVTRVNVTLTTSIGDVSVEGVVKTASGSQKSQELPSGRERPRRLEGTKEHDSANSTSSHKDSSDEDNFPGTNIQGNKSLSSSAEATGPVSVGRCPKLKSRRDRDRKRKRSELNYATHRPKILKSTEDSTSTTTVISHNEGNSTNVLHENASAAGGRDATVITSVPNHTAATLTPAISENSTGNLIDGAAATFSENASSSSSHLANQDKDE
ncbi:hypothetical protein Ocin01_07458 [Orchesella cincta]|uniref:Uncharacterized protein n=1 Tax=Orchesella cincta TaxID=48709 RepID=A0A1D2N1W5_ORCCI|nr:hypothetical protein Ocin01_07458 [Orchesella cincta]